MCACCLVLLSPIHLEKIIMGIIKRFSTIYTRNLIHKVEGTAFLDWMRRNLGIGAPNFDEVSNNKLIMYTNQKILTWTCVSMKYCTITLVYKYKLKELWLHTSHRFALCNAIYLSTYFKLWSGLHKCNYYTKLEYTRLQGYYQFVGYYHHFCVMFTKMLLTSLKMDIFI